MVCESIVRRSIEFITTLLFNNFNQIKRKERFWQILVSIFNEREKEKEGSLGINESRSSVLMGISKLLESICARVAGLRYHTWYTCHLPTKKDRLFFHLPLLCTTRQTKSFSSIPLFPLFPLLAGLCICHLSPGNLISTNLTFALFPSNPNNYQTPLFYAFLFFYLLLQIPSFPQPPQFYNFSTTNDHMK